MFVVKKSSRNPILSPRREHYWEASAVFNLSPIKHGQKIYGVYRAVSNADALRTPHEISVIGSATSIDGAIFEHREQFILPEESWEKFGCEDPRIIYFEGRYYIFYTALSNYPFSGEGIKIGVAISSDLKRVEEKHLVTPFNAKAMALFPERINGKVTAILTAHTEDLPAKIAIAQADKIEEFWSPEFWKKWEQNIDSCFLHLKRDDYDHVEVGAVPLKTENGWLLIYAHIRNYFPGNGDPLFGIEAVLLDLNDPTKIIGRTTWPIIVPEESYEIQRHGANIVFPSGALIHEDTLSIYYGASDITVCLAEVKLSDLLSSIDPSVKDWRLKRSPANPILLPDGFRDWESLAVLNPAAIDLGGRVHILYRAMSKDNVSTIGCAISADGLAITERLPEPIYVPRADFEKKRVEGANSGCEDPRIVNINGTLYIFYTAYDGIGPPRVAVSSISEKDFLARKWNWQEPVLITPAGFDDKDTCIIPGTFNGKYFILHRIGNDICGDYLDSLNFEKEKVDMSIQILAPRPGLWDSEKVGISTPPIKTPYGWILLYHAISKADHSYRVGVALLDLADPTVVLARSTDPIFEPEMDYEKRGVVDNVVFPCGAIIRDGVMYVYYGGADKVVGVATMPLNIILNALRAGAKL